MKLVIAATGASGSIYLQRLLEQIDTAAHEIHLVLSGHAKQVAKQELGAFKIPKSVAQYGENDLNVPFVSGSARFDAMVIVPCSMATLGESRPAAATLRFCARPTFFERATQIDRRSARNALEFDPRPQHRHAVGSRRDRAAGDSFFLQPPNVP